jgi:hypothetical protein
MEHLVNISVDWAVDAMGWLWVHAMLGTVYHPTLAIVPQALRRRAPAAH